MAGVGCKGAATAPADLKYPLRKIAKAIESALHFAYDNQRIRREWFNLSEKDVSALIETLK